MSMFALSFVYKVCISSYVEVLGLKSEPAETHEVLSPMTGKNIRSTATQK